MFTSTLPPRISPHTKDQDLRKAIEYVLQRFHSNKAIPQCSESRKLLLASLIEVLCSMSPDYGAPPKAKIDLFLQTLDDIETSQEELLDGERRQLAEVVEELEELRAKKARVLDTTLLAKIAAAIKYREGLMRDGDLILNGNGDDNIGLKGTREKITEELEQIGKGAFTTEKDKKERTAKLNAQLVQVNRAITEQVEMAQRHMSTKEKLEMYRQAMHRVAAGIDNELLIVVKK
jgi:hypothetical protein